MRFFGLQLRFSLFYRFAGLLCGTWPIFCFLLYYNKQRMYESVLASSAPAAYNTDLYTGFSILNHLKAVIE